MPSHGRWNGYDPAREHAVGDSIINAFDNADAEEARTVIEIVSDDRADQRGEGF
ncbi:hypothetical protein MKK64_01810 [Methylobacterium sp. E-025]|jgi:hypothetical protein|uniref:hypothetical protein n=1 Tax=Methylobacterium sp. E-025 TaxID=2836561 RepID=UPI001FBAEE62|nr:hypothetical protein [Methylobacterium sp. E-025]MCJ2109961.1 hypothetical protein [Methylobacterium sp. E-025]